MAAQRGKHTCKCKWWKWVGNSKQRWKAADLRGMKRGDDRG